MSMKILTTDVEIREDGTIHLEVPSGLAPGPAEVVVVVQPKGTVGGLGKVRSGLFQGKPLNGFDLDAALDQMNAEWKAQLESSR